MKIKLFVHAKYRHHAKSPAVTANTVIPYGCKLLEKYISVAYIFNDANCFRKMWRGGAKKDGANLSEQSSWKNNAVVQRIKKCNKIFIYVLII